MVPPFEQNGRRNLWDPTSCIPQENESCAHSKSEIEGPDGTSIFFACPPNFFKSAYL